MMMLVQHSLLNVLSQRLVSTEIVKSFYSSDGIKNYVCSSSMLSIRQSQFFTE